MEAEDITEDIESDKLANEDDSVPIFEDQRGSS